MADSEGSDGEEDQVQDVSASEAVKHDDFDYATIFVDLSQVAPQMTEIFEAARKFGDGHRHLINKFLFEASMRTNKMNLIFAKYITTVRLKRHPEAVMKIKTTHEESRELTKMLMRTMNKEKGKSVPSFTPWRFVLSSDEKTPREYVTMTGCTQNSTIISDASDMKKEERVLLLTILEEMMKGDGTVKLRWVHDQIKQGACKMVETRYDNFLSKMSRLKYLIMDIDSETLEITPRILVELESWVRAKFVGQLKICDFCRKIIARSKFTAKCTNCSTVIHFNCFVNATAISKKGSIECQKCKTMLTSQEVDDQMKALKSGSSSSRNTSKPNRNSQPLSDSDSDGGDATTNPRTNATMADSDED